MTFDEIETNGTKRLFQTSGLETTFNDPSENLKRSFRSSDQKSSIIFKLTSDWSTCDCWSKIDSLKLEFIGLIIGAKRLILCGLLVKFQRMGCFISSTPSRKLIIFPDGNIANPTCGRSDVFKMCLQLLSEL